MVWLRPWGAGICQPRYPDVVKSGAAPACNPRAVTGASSKSGQPRPTQTVAFPRATAGPLQPCKQSAIAKKSISTTTGMFHILQQRTRDIIEDINETLCGICLDARLMPMATERQIIRSSASTPSLRARDGSIPMHARMDPGGNVRVVVRVRAFLPRGESALLLDRYPLRGES
jgi:hypothetical protein